MNEIDVNLFLEIIVSEGCHLLQQVTVKDDVIEFYHGLNGRKVPINISDEFIDVITARHLLIQLGLENLIDRGFLNS